MLCLHQFAKDNRRFSCSGALMLLAWMVTGSVGTVIASFYKPDWPCKTLFGQKVWFQVNSMHPQALATIVLLFSFHDTLFSLTLFLASSRAYDAHCHFDHCSLLPPIFLQERLEQSISHMTTHTKFNIMFNFFIVGLLVMQQIWYNQLKIQDINTVVSMRRGIQWVM